MGSLVFILSATALRTFADTVIRFGHHDRVAVRFFKKPFKGSPVWWLSIESSMRGTLCTRMITEDIASLHEKRIFTILRNSLESTTDQIMNCPTRIEIFKHGSKGTGRTSYCVDPKDPKTNRDFSDWVSELIDPGSISRTQ